MLELSNVAVKYGKNTAVSGVSLSIAENSFVALVGANGAGKTSLLRAISGVVPYEGSIKFKGREVADHRVDQLVRLGLSHVPQGRLLFPRMSVRDNLSLGGYAREKNAAETRRGQLEGRIDLLRRRRNQLTRTLSGGEQQIVAVTRGLVANPDLLLLDEPSLGLAPVMIKNVMSIVKEEYDSGLTLLLAEQNLTLAREHADRLIVMRQGRVVLDVPTKEGIDDRDLHAAYLGE